MKDNCAVNDDFESLQDTPATEKVPGAEMPAEEEDFNSLAVTPASAMLVLY